MRKILFVLCSLLLSASTYAKQPYDINEAQKIAAENNAPGLAVEHEGEYIYFDYEEKLYFSKKDFIEKYGRNAVQQIMDEERKRIEKESKALAHIEKQNKQTEAFQKLMALDSYESVSYNKNKYDDILDCLDGVNDGEIDYLTAALFFRDNIAGIDKNGNISMINIIECPGFTKEHIYIQANSWFVNTFNSGKSVIQLNDKEAGTILAKGFLKNIAEQVGFAISYEVSAYILFRIDIKDGRCRLITTIQEYESVNRGGVAGALSGSIQTSTGTYKPDRVYPFYQGNAGLSKKAGAKAYCACCMYMIAMKNQFDKAINDGIIGSDIEEW